MISGNPPSSPGTPPSLSFMADCHTAMVIILLDFIDPDFEFRSWDPSYFEFRRWRAMNEYIINFSPFTHVGS